MRAECDQFAGFQNKYNVCNGDSDLPEWKIDRYRVRWGLEPLFNAKAPECPEREEVVVGQGPRRKLHRQSNEGVNDELGQGPGTELLAIYKEAGIPSCSRCYDLAVLMNKWGADKCEQQIEFLVGDILPRAQSWIANNKPWIHKLLPNIVEKTGIQMKIRHDIKIAIDRSRQKPIKKAPRKRGGCGCG
jgi:hypothetical protein